VRNGLYSAYVLSKETMEGRVDVDWFRIVRHKKALPQTAYGFDGKQQANSKNVHPEL